jgi:hypothetical protein
MKLLKILRHVGDADYWLMECGVHGNEFIAGPAQRKSGTVKCRHCEEWMSVDELVKEYEKEIQKPSSAT